MSQSSGFWTGGPGAYRKGLREAREQELSVLRTELENAEAESEKEEIKVRMRKVRSEYKQNVRGIDRCLF